jgi:hypothetical protein
MVQSASTDEKFGPTVGLESGEGLQTVIPAAEANGGEKYPTGIRSILIIIALCLALFLISLDMVC